MTCKKSNLVLYRQANRVQGLIEAGLDDSHCPLCFYRRSEIIEMLAPRLRGRYALVMNIQDKLGSIANSWSDPALSRAMFL
jgi:hypothetical protein